MKFCLTQFKASTFTQLGNLQMERFDLNLRFCIICTHASVTSPHVIGSETASNHDVIKKSTRQPVANVKMRRKRAFLFCANQRFFEVIKIKNQYLPWLLLGNSWQIKLKSGETLKVC